MTDLFFPSEDHRRSLVDRVEADGLKALGAQELLEFHAYRYAWRRVRLGNFEQSYGCDSKGNYFDGVLVNRATDFYRPKPRERRRPPLDGGLPFVPPASATAEQIEVWREQWRQLAVTRLAADAETAAGIKQGPAALAHVDLACRFVAENLAAWGEVQKRTAGDDDDLAVIQAGLGLEVRETVSEEV